MSDALKPLIAAAAEGPLGAEQARQAFDILFEGRASAAQIGGLLMAMQGDAEYLHGECLCGGGRGGCGGQAW